MRFFATLTVAFGALATLVAGQSGGGNSFNNPPGGYQFVPGKPTDLTWSNPTGSTVTLTIRSGSNGNLDKGTVIQANAPNTGKYTWNVPSSLPTGGSYTIEIKNDQDPSSVNYTPQFAISNPNAGATSAATAATSAASGATSAATAATTAATTGASTGATTGATTAAPSTGTASATGATTASGSAATGSTLATRATSGSSSGSATRSAATGTGTTTSVPTTNAGARLVGAGSGLALAAAVGLAAL